MLEYRENGGMIVNKSHAAAYAVLSCRTAYHKARHLAVFYAATLNHQTDPKKMKNILSEVVTSSITLIPPRLSNHTYQFVGNENGNTVKFGLRGIKGFGDSMKNVTIRYAENLYEFCLLNPDIPKDNMESLIKVGFFDEWGFTREALLEAFPVCLKQLEKQSDSEEFDFYQEKVYPILRDNLIETQSDEMTFKSLGWEDELMGISTSISTGIQNIKSHRNTKPYTGEEGWFNFAVASCAEPKSTKKGNIYYEVTLVDAAGNFFKRRFSEPITKPSIRAYVNDDKHKHFITDCDKYPIEALTRVQYNLDIAEIERKNLTKIFQTEESEVYSKKVIADATGEILFVRPKIFDALKEQNLLYEADFKKMVLV